MNFLIPLEEDGETHRASLTFDDTEKRGSIRYRGTHVCDFELETAGAVANYFTAEKLVRAQISAILGIEVMPVDTGAIV